MILRWPLFDHKRSSWHTDDNRANRCKGPRFLILLSQWIGQHMWPSPVCLLQATNFYTFYHNLINLLNFYFSSVQFSHSVVSDSLQPHELQHARPPCPSPTPGIHSNSHPSSWWWHPAISSSVVPFSSFPQSLPASESFPVSQLFVWGGQSTQVSASASFLPMNTQAWSPLEWTGWISLQSKGLSRVGHNWATELNFTRRKKNVY